MAERIIAFVEAGGGASGPGGGRRAAAAAGAPHVGWFAPGGWRPEQIRKEAEESTHRWGWGWGLGWEGEGQQREGRGRADAWGVGLAGAAGVKYGVHGGRFGAATPPAALLTPALSLDPLIATPPCRHPPLQAT